MKRLLSFFSLSAALGAALFLSGCAVGGGYGYADVAPVGAGVYYGDYGAYGGPYYGGYGPYYGGTAVVIGGSRSYRRGYYGGHHLYGGRYGRNSSFRGAGFGAGRSFARPGGGFRGPGIGAGRVGGARAGGRR